MSFSTLLMPLGLYTPFVDGIGHVDMNILIREPSAPLSQSSVCPKPSTALFDNFYCLAFHGIIGIVIAATIMTIPFSGFSSPEAVFINLICMLAGILAALLLDRFNSRIKVDTP